MAVKKSTAEYTIRYSGRRTLDEYRGDRITGRVFTVTKFVPDTNELTEYEVTLSTFGEECTCPGGRHPMCKHRHMALEYLKEHADDFEE